jgi:hypothetical protein
MMATEIRKWTRKRTAATALLVLAAGLTVAGCAKKREFGEVYGKVTFRGKPVTQGNVVFADEEWGTFMKAPIQPDGSYELRPTQGGVGLYLKGVYKVSVVPPIVDGPQGITKTPTVVPDPADIPRKYRSSQTSGLEFELTKPRQQFDIPMN